MTDPGLADFGPSWRPYECGVAAARPHRLGMTYEDWLASVPAAATEEPVWHVQAYRIGLYLAACAWDDAEALKADPRSTAAMEQLTRATASIAANVAEGYCRRSAADRKRFFEYALGSAAEVRAWYLASARALGNDLVASRMKDLLSVTRLLLEMIRRERVKGRMKEN